MTAARAAGSAMFEPAVETLPWEAQAPADEAAYRDQIARLFAHSPFYRKKLTEAGFADAAAVGGLEAIAALPFTEKDELRATRSEAEPIGTHLAVPMSALARIYSTSGTTGTPSYVPLTADDLADWTTISARSYAASGVGRGDRLITTYNVGPFVAGATMDAFTRLGLTVIPVGSGNTDRLMAAIRLLNADTVALTPSYALHLAEWAMEHGINPAETSVRRLLVAGEPGGGEPAMRARLEGAWDAEVTEAMGIGDISVSLWGECHHRQGMHFSARGLVHFELIDPETGTPVPLTDGAEGELVYTHLRHRAAPLLRFRSRDHVRVWVSPCPCGRTAPRVRCIGRTDDMLIVRGVNVFPTAVREVVNEFVPAVSGVIAIRPRVKAVRQDPPLKVVVELAEGELPGNLAERIRARIREKLIFTADVVLAPFLSLGRSSYKSHLTDWSEAAPQKQ
jgi:phenylacetate-CoA ligase